MTNNLKILFVAFLASVIFFSCSKDNEAPTISNFKVNSVITTGTSGNHNLGETLTFEMNVMDNTELAEYQVRNESSGSTPIGSGTLTGTADLILFIFDIDASVYMSGETVLLSFIVEDNRGSSTIRQYTIAIQ